MSVEYGGQSFLAETKKGGLVLDLSNQGIKDITEIKGLADLTNLRVLNLNKNLITEITGLDKLTSLETLYLDNNFISEIKGLDNLVSLKNLLLNYNKISEIKGLGNLDNLKRIELKGNPVRDFAKKEFGRYWANPEPMIRYCKAMGTGDISKETIPATISTPLEGDKSKLLIFISYATKDAEMFKIKNIAEKLSAYDEIGNVLYWQEDMHDNIIKYMNDNLGKCNIVLLFCSPNALASQPVEKEWTAADAMNKPIIPVFMNSDHIPPLLRSRLGYEFKPFSLEENITNLYNLILKKSQG